MLTNLTFALLAMLAQQDDPFAIAQQNYAGAHESAKDVAVSLAHRVEQAEQRVASLQSSIADHAHALTSMTDVENRQFLWLKSNFEGAELEKKLKEQQARFALERSRLQDQIAIEREQLADATNRLASLKSEHAMAEIEAAHSPESKPGASKTPETDRMQAQANAEMLARARTIGRFTLQPVPRTWMPARRS